jgi:hypothetical protein
MKKGKKYQPTAFIQKKMAANNIDDKNIIDKIKILLEKN